MSFFHTWSRTFAVSRGKVTKSATHAAVPAPKTFTAVVGGMGSALRTATIIAVTFYEWLSGELCVGMQTTLDTPRILGASGDRL